jgi:hypothetical protein
MPTISETAAAAAATVAAATKEESFPIQEFSNEVHIEGEGQDVGSTGQPKEVAIDTPASPTDSGKCPLELPPLPRVATDAEVALLNEIVKQIMAAAEVASEEVENAQEAEAAPEEVEEPEGDLASDDYIDEFVKDVIDGCNDIEYQDIYDSNYTPKYVKIIRKGPVQITVSNNKIPTSTLLILLLLQPAIYAILYAFLTR